MQINSQVPTPEMPDKIEPLLINDLKGPDKMELEAKANFSQPTAIASDGMSREGSISDQKMRLEKPQGEDQEISSSIKDLIKIN